MPAVLVRSFVVVGLGALALAGLLYVASTVDARPPEVLGFGLTQPLAEDPQRALITTSLEVTFSEPIDEDSAARVISFDPPVEGSVSWSGSSMIFTPRELLGLETEYAVTVAPGARDLAGNVMTEAAPSYRFVTAGRPEISGTVPAADSDGVPLDTPIQVTFSTLMDTASVESALALRPAFAHQLRWSGELLEIVPEEPLDPDREYRIRIGAEAADVAGVQLGESFTASFRTTAPGLAVETLVPAPATDGIGPTSPIAVIFDRPLDRDSVSGDLLELSPAVAGSLDVVPLPGEDDDAADGGRLLRFTPSAPLAPNTTFEVVLDPGVTSSNGGGLASPVRWSFTTGAPLGTLSNQITFLSDRSGVTNVWAMNPDGTGARQLSTELAPVLDYAVSPDGSSLVVADGRRLVYLRPDGSDRQVLTDEALIEFDPAYAPNGRRLAFGRADARTGAGLGLWHREVAGGTPQQIRLPADPVDGSSPPAARDQPDEAAGGMLRAPRYSPDGLAVAFVAETGGVGIIEPAEEGLTLAPAGAVAPPAWLPDSSGVLVTQITGSRPGRGQPRDDGRVPPLAPPVGEPRLRIGMLLRGGSAVEATRLGSAAVLAAVAADGRIAYLADGSLYLAEGPDDAGSRAIDSAAGAAFAPGESGVAVVIGASDEADATDGRIELLDPDTGERTILSNDGWRLRWLP